MDASVRAKSRSLVPLGIVTWVLVAVSLALIFFYAREADAAMGGQLQRIFYVHVPAAWVAYLSFGVVFLASIAYLRTSKNVWDLVAGAAAEIGVLFTTLVLITGPIWARPVWGTWWQWDARLTSALVMWLTYVGYLFMRNLALEPARAARPAAVLGIAGFVNVPIVHFSVQWWRTLHPQGPTPADLARESGLGAPELVTFFVSLVAFTLLFSLLLAIRVRVGRAHAHLEATELQVERARGRAQAPDPVVSAP